MVWTGSKCLPAPWRQSYPPCPPPRPQPVKPIAMPPFVPHYVVPCSHLLDPPYSWMSNPNIPPWWAGQWPLPRLPWRYESETRAPGTGLITGPQPCPPPPPSPCGGQRYGQW